MLATEKVFSWGSQMEHVGSLPSVDPTPQHTGFRLHDVNELCCFFSLFVLLRLSNFTSEHMYRRPKTAAETSYRTRERTCQGCKN